MEDNNANHLLRGLLMGTIAGGVSGFVMGLLLAPEEGQKARRRVMYRAERLAAQARDFAERLVLPEAESEARRSGRALIDDAREQAEQILRDADALLDEMRQSQQFS